MTCRDHPTAAEAWTESRTDATAAEPVFLSDFSKNIFPQKYLRLSPDIRKYFFRENIGLMLSAFLQEYVCIESLFLKRYFPRKLFHLTLFFQKIFPKKTFLPHSLFSEIIFPRNYYPPPPRLLPPAPPLLLLLLPLLLPCWFLIISLTCINFLIRISTSNKIFFDKSR